MVGNILLLILVVAPMVAAVIGYIIGRQSKIARDYFADIVTTLEFLIMIGLAIAVASGQEVALKIPEVCGMGLYFKLDGFRVIFATMTTFMWMMTTIFSKEYLAHARNRNRYYFFLLITLGATVGVFLSDDMFTTFVFFEMMSMASYVCVVHDEKKAAMEAGGVYLAVAVIGGMVTLMGLFMVYHMTGTLQLEELLPAIEPLFADHQAWFYIAGGCILFGFGAKAGMYPLHIWLPMAHPVAPAPASALLSGIITKTGIFGVIVITSRIFFYNGYWAMTLLLLGVVTAFLGGLLAVFSLDLKRTLACSSMSQLGFILIGIAMQGLLGEHNALAVRGTMLHMFNHSNLKLVLFMGAGVVVMNLHKLDLNDIRGFGRKKPLLLYVFLMGSLGIGGIPLFNGYVSKTLIHESIVEYIELLEEGHSAQTFAFAMGHGAVGLFKTIEWLFIITGAMTVAYMTKIVVALFFEKNNDPEVQAKFDAKKNYCNQSSAAVLLVTATILPILGVVPNIIMDALADFGQGFMFGHSPHHAVHYFSWVNLKGGLYSIGIGALIYLVFIRGFILQKQASGQTVYVNRWPSWLDLLKLIYYPVVMVILPAVCGFVCKCLDKLLDTIMPIIVAITGFVTKCMDLILDTMLPILLAIAAFFTRCMDYSLDALIVLARKTTHRQLHGGKAPPKGYRTSFILGTICNVIAKWLNKTFFKKKPLRRDYVLRFAEKERLLKESNKIIVASVSFSFIMFGIGMIVTVLYIFLS